MGRRLLLNEALVLLALSKLLSLLRGLGILILQDSAHISHCCVFFSLIFNTRLVSLSLTSSLIDGRREERRGVESRCLGKWWITEEDLLILLGVPNLTLIWAGLRMDDIWMGLCFDKVPNMFVDFRACWQAISEAIFEVFIEKLEPGNEFLLVSNPQNPKTPNTLKLYKWFWIKAALLTFIHLNPASRVLTRISLYFKRLRLP